MRPEFEVGSRWLLWGKVRVVAAREENRRRGQCYGGPALCMIPEDRLDKKPIWNDWVEEARVDKYGTPLQPGEDFVPPVRQSAVEVAVAKARKRKPITLERQLANKITSTRYKMKNPAKSRRDSWTPAEIKEMQALIDTTVEELRLLKEEKA